MHKAYLMFFGLPGYTFYCIPEGSSSELKISGYKKPENFNFEDNSDVDFEDCIVINKISVLKENPSLALLSPLCNYSVEDDKIENCPTLSPVLVNGLSKTYKTLLSIDQIYKKSNKKEYSPLDTVSPKNYSKWWKNHGAKIGVVKNNEIIWSE